jgi:hypothetical protein
LKLEEITPNNLENMILTYLKSGNSKYAYAYLPDLDMEEGLDPYADLGDVAPGEDPKKRENITAKYANIDEHIEMADNNREYEKMGYLRNIKQMLMLRQYASNNSERDSIDMVIEQTQKKIDELNEQEDEREGEEYEAEGEEDFDQYDSQGPKSKYTVPGETLEERREKGLKEIFSHYARSQMMIGRKATFEQIQHEISNLNLGEYMKF